MKKTIDTLLADIDELLQNRESHELDVDNVLDFATSCGLFVEETFKKRDTKTLRMSNIGRPDRQLWYDFHYDKEVPKLASKDVIKFLYGHMVEALIVLLVKEAGHTFTNAQKEVVVDGIVGHIDGDVDDTLTDVKSASNFGFKKFFDGSLLTGDDSFGYIPQLSGYAQALGRKEAAFLVANKVDGSLCILKLEGMELDDVKPRIKHIKEVVASTTMPERCYEGKPEGAKGNLLLPFVCGYCPYKESCWQDANGGVGIRTFQYAQAPKRFVKVTEKGLPRVEEILNEN